MSEVYVGARYVPKFFANPNGTCEWLGNVPYEPLTIVTYLGNSYTSKVPVPPGIGNPSLNPTYWALTGNYSAQVEDYRQEVDVVKNNIEQVEAIVDNLQVRKGNRSVVLLTDSYGTSFNGTITPFQVTLAQKMGLRLNYTFAYMAYAGAGFVSDGRTFLKVLNDFVLPSTMQASKVTDLIVAGGCNDRGFDVDQIQSAIQEFVTRAKVLFPNATVRIALIGGFNNLGNKVSLAETALPAYMNCQNFGAVPLPNMNYVMQDSRLYQADNIHPNQNGENQIASALYAALNSGYESVINPAINIVTPADWITGGSLKSSIRAVNELLTFIAYTSTPLTFTSRSLSGNVSLGRVVSPHILGNVDFQTAAIISVLAGGTATHGIATLSLYNGELLIAFNQNYQDATALSFSRTVLHISRSYC